MDISKHFNVTNETDNCKKTKNKTKKTPPAKIYKYLKTTRGNPKIAFFFYLNICYLKKESKIPYMHT